MEVVLKIIENFSIGDWVNFISIIISSIMTFISIYFVNENTNKQIANQNKETYKPRLRLKKITNLKDVKYKNCLCANGSYFDYNGECVTLFLDIELENIGNGLANNISFYVLNNGYKCSNYQNINYETNQLLGSTLEVPKGEKETFRFCFNFNKIYLDNKDKYNNGDYIILVCNYKDLNNNNYKLIIGYILKNYEVIKSKSKDNNYIVYNDGCFSSYYYQEDTLEFKQLVNIDYYKENYKRILDSIDKESF